MRESSATIRVNNIRMMACAFGGCRAIISSVIRNSCDLRAMSRIPPAARSPVFRSRRCRGVNGYAATIYGKDAQNAFAVLFRTDGFPDAAVHELEKPASAVQ
jgi:hypothetical protein